MWPILGILIVAIGIILFEVPSMLEKKLIRELKIFSILLILGVVLSIAESLNLDIPNPTQWLDTIYKPLTDLIMNALE